MSHLKILCLVSVSLLSLTTNTTVTITTVTITTITLTTVTITITITKSQFFFSYIKVLFKNNFESKKILVIKKFQSEIFFSHTNFLVTKKLILVAKKF